MKRKHALSTSAMMVALSFYVAASAQAGMVLFTNESAFRSAVSATGTDNFDDLPSEELAGPLGRRAGRYEYRISVGPSDAGFFPVMDQGDVYLSPTIASDVMTFSNFGSSVFGFSGSFFATDAYGAFEPGRALELSTTDGINSATYLLDGALSNSFFGVVSTDPLTEFSLRTINEAGNVYWASANNLVLAGAAQPVSEPSSYAMFVIGAGLIGLGARRNKRSAIAFRNMNDTISY